MRNEEKEDGKEARRREEKEKPGQKGRREKEAKEVDLRPKRSMGGHKEPGKKVLEKREGEKEVWTC